jgi:hypothetical protein
MSSYTLGPVGFIRSTMNGWHDAPRQGHRGILRRAFQSFATPLGTQDALHLMEFVKSELKFRAHDIELATAASSMNFEVEGA